MRARCREFGRRIAYSTRGSKNLGIGMDLSDANSRPLRSPGILARRALRGFLPLRRQLLDQPSWRCGHRGQCGTLATNSMRRLEQIMCQTRRADRGSSMGLIMSAIRSTRLGKPIESRITMLLCGRRIFRLGCAQTQIGRFWGKLLKISS
jgi:hypothetical protein